MAGGMVDTKTLCEEFRKTAAAAYESFPEKLDKLVVLIDSSLEPVFISADIADELSGNTRAIKAALEDAFPHYAPNRAGLAEYDYPMADKVVKLIALKEEPRGIFSSRYTQKMLGTPFFNHEIGHLVVKNGTGFAPKHLAECAADAYAALRHVQQFGKDTDFFEYFNRAHVIVLGLTPSHYTDAVIQRVKQLSEEMDIGGLSLQETAKLAGEIALDCELKEITLEAISEAFAPVHRFCRAMGDPGDIVSKLYNDGDETWPLLFKETLEVIKKHQNDPDVVAAGRQFLSHPARKNFIEGLAKTDPYWQEAIKLIEQPVSVKDDNSRQPQRSRSPSPA